MLQPSDPPQLVSSSTSSSAGQTESSRQLPQQAQYPYHYQQQVQYGHYVAPPQQTYGPGSQTEPASGVQGDRGKIISVMPHLLHRLWG